MMSGKMDLELRLITFSIFDSVSMKVGFFNICCSHFLPFIALTFSSQAKLMRRRRSCTLSPVSRSPSPSASPTSSLVSIFVLVLILILRYCWTLPSRRTESTGAPEVTPRKGKPTDPRCPLPHFLSQQGTSSTNIC